MIDKSNCRHQLVDRITRITTDTRVIFFVYRIGGRGAGSVAR